MPGDDEYEQFLAEQRLTDEQRYQQHVEARASSIGLPTEPEAYAEGEFVAVTTTPDLPQADLLASLLRGEGIPALVADPYMAALYWHAQCGLYPAGIRVLVPAGRLKDAQAFLQTRGTPDIGAVFDKDPVPPEAQLHLKRRARALAFLTLAFTFLFPLWMILAYHTAVRARRLVREFGPTPELTKASRWALAVLAINGLLFVLLILIGLSSLVPFGE